MTETVSAKEGSKRHGRHSKFSLRGSTPWAPPAAVAPPPQPLPKWASKRYERMAEKKAKADVGSASGSEEEEEMSPGSVLRDNCKVRLNRVTMLSRILDEELRDFMYYMELTPAEKKTRHDIASRVRRCTSELFPDSTLEVFGSWSTDLCIPSSDIDFTLCGVEASQAYSLSTYLQRENFTTHLITNTKVPLIRLTDVASGVHADISFNMKRAAASAANMKRLLRKYRLARPLIIALKNILKLGNVNELYTGGLSSYSLSLMVISYLQHVHEDDISMDDDDDEKDESDSSDNSEASSAEMSTNSGLEGYRGLGAAFVGFLETYGMEPEALNLEDITISVAEAKYKSRSEAVCNSIAGTHLSLEDPLNKENDVARGTFRFADVRMLFSTTLKIMRWYEHCTRLWEEKKNMRAYQQQLAPPPTPLMAVFGCDPREWNPMWGQPHPLSWRHPMVMPWGHHGHGVPMLSHPPMQSAVPPAAGLQNDSLFSRFKTSVDVASTGQPVPPQPQPAPTEHTAPLPTKDHGSIHQNPNAYQPPFRQKGQSSLSSSSSEGLTRSAPDAASTSGSMSSSGEDK
eukprot:TRINITY_DN13626_c0_g1_i1.p1 TRINITY_DN13626_c0_g1~~TRINITY_DN13626_c0_g1_i1.p1  ORF type:complete len:572 (+),score=151.36 TRINITY_DN13626_c0_g1_i1:113-1828(+)